MTAAAALLAALAAAGAAAGRPPVSPERLALVRQVTEAALSPDGSRLAFVTDITGALEAWLVPALGGWPEQLTALGEQVSGLEWSPDGRRLAFSSDFGGDERPDLYLVDAAGGEAVNLTSSTAADTDPAFSPDGRSLAFLSDPGRPFLFQLMTLDLRTRRARQLTREAVNVHGPVWSRDGRTIAAFRSGDDRTGELLLVPARGGKARVVAPPTAGGLLVPAEFSPDGSGLLCLARNARGFAQLYLLDLRTLAGRFLGPDDREVEEARWHPAAGIVFSSQRGAASALSRLASPGAPAEDLLAPGGRVEGFGLDGAGKTLVYLWSDSRTPPDAWALDLASGFRRRLTRSALGGVTPESLARAETIRYPSFDGREIEAVYLKPKAPRLGHPPPAVVMVHGGPDWQVFDDFHPLRQALAEAGFAVVAPNFRGSTGYGIEFQTANRKDWGGADRRDLIEAVRHLSAKGELDARRVGITGGSYGGFMTLYALARSEGEWAAGVEAYGMPDLVLDYEISKDRFADWYEAQMGNPKADAELFRERSAVNFLDGIKAPLLIFQGANDTNVPKAESELIHARLSELGRPSELVVYPDEGHGFTKRRNLTDYYRRTVAFFVEHLGERR